MSSSSACIPELERLLNELEQLAGQTAVHRKKFEFAVNQFRRFLVAFSTTANFNPFTSAQIESYRTMCENLSELHQLLCQHQLHNWAHPTLENPSSYVASSLTNLAGRLQQTTSLLCESASKLFDGDSPQWLQYHLLDLKCISASFKQYLKSAKSDDSVVPMMQDRLQSVDAFLQKYENEQVAAGIRVFSPIPVHYQQWRLNYEDLQEVKEIGSGVSANVFYGFHKPSGKEVAIKRLKFKKLSGGKLQAFQREVAILASAIHPTLVGFVGATDTKPFCIVTEWMAGGSLYHELHKFKRLNATMRSIAAFDIARGMQFLHSKHIIHRDLKSLNVLLDANGYARICDFGFSRVSTDEDKLLTTNVGTPHWMAPELLAATPGYNNKIDVYAYGIVLWEIVTGQLPFAGLESTQIIGQVLMNDARPPIPEQTNEPLQELMKQCWDKNPEKRPTFDEIVRRMIAGPIILNGADVTEFQQYVQEKVGFLETPSERLTSRLEMHKDKDKENAEETLNGLIEALEQEGVPAELATRCWSVVEEANAKNVPPSLLGRASALFLGSPVRATAAALMRSLPCGTIPPKTMSSAVELIPTGSEELDLDIIVAACKNGAADFAAVYALLPQHVKLALEVVAEHGVDLSLKAAVADRCVQNLRSEDSQLVCAAVRCLLGIGETRRITISVLKDILKSQNKALKNAAGVAAASLALCGVELSMDILSFLLAISFNDPIASTAVVAACQHPETAIHVINRITYEQQIEPETALRILLMASQHNEPRPAVMIALKYINFDKIKDKYGDVIQKLEKFVTPKQYSLIMNKLFHVF